ncbi:type II secretion system GspH family protein, partial [bacterium]|nr:type II secretion system GspH family protein [bacterium]
MMKNRKEGFSLIELLLVISFISVIILLIFNISFFNKRVW